jgi:hypothetical protein
MNLRMHLGRPLAFLALLLPLALVGCGTIQRRGLEPGHAQEMAKALDRHDVRLNPELEDRILALDPARVSAQDVREVLSQAPAPRVLNIHGGLARVIPRMVSFSEFLVGMGYPDQSLAHPSDGTYSFSCYESSAKIVGVLAWYYEKEGLRPMLVGHSQGGMQVVKVLHRLARPPPGRLFVWNPLTWEREPRSEIVDPLTGQPRPIAGLVLPYATAVGAGGVTRLLPNQWDMTFRLRKIPDSVEEFTGFCKRFDLLGGDLLGYGALNHYHANGQAAVRNVWLPTRYRHGYIPDTQHLPASPSIREWIDQYHPAADAVIRLQLEGEFDDDSRHILWAADVWYSIKKHWVLELQRRIRAQRDHSS